MNSETEGWMPRPQWDAMVRGETCPICVELSKDEAEGEEGYVVADLRISRLRLQRNQYVRGYCVLMCQVHAKEPYELPREQAVAFFDDLMDVGRALDAVFKPLKMNFQILGNAVPHVHAHVMPRYYGDPAPHYPIDPWEGERILEPAEYESVVNEIRAALGAT